MTTTATSTGLRTLRTVRSFCRICTSVCGILVDVAQNGSGSDDVVRVHGDPTHPMSRGYTCAKGRALPQMHHHPNRIERPMLRVGEQLEPTSWEHCLDDLAARLQRVLEDDGPAAIGVFFGSGVGMDAAGYRMAEALHRALGTPARFSPLTIDGTAKTLVAHQMGGTPALSAHVDDARAELVLFIGVNPVVSHGHGGGMPDPITVLRALRAHAEIWVLDPRRTETARLAGHHLAPRPGTDYAVVAFLVREVLRDGADRETIERHTVGRDALAAAVEPFTLDHAARVADVDAADLLGLLGAVRRAGCVAIDTGTGVTMADTANVTQWLAWALMIITGAMNRPGGVWFHPGFLRRPESFELPVLPPDALFGPGPKQRTDAQACSSVSGRARCCPTRSSTATSAPSSTSAVTS